jgi:uncharacterized membrane protein
MTSIRARQAHPTRNPVSCESCRRRWSGGVAWQLLWQTLAVLTGFGLALVHAMGMAAHAEFKVCNQTLNFFNLAIGYPSEPARLAEPVYGTEGWWPLAANSCTSPIKEPLQERYIYLYGIDVHGTPVIVGAMKMCVDRRQYFNIRGTDECWVRGGEPALFLEVDTGPWDSWTVFIRN